MLAYDAMMFARAVHAEQRRKFTRNPYHDHLAEVAGVVASVAHDGEVPAEVMISVAWLHDAIEDQDVTEADLAARFGVQVAGGVRALSDLEEGDRATRKALSRARLAAAPGWVQTVKVADIISNTSSIAMHDAVFAQTYLEEKRLLLDVLTHADPRLLEIARAQVK